MKKLIIIVSLLALAVVAFAAKPDLPVDGKGIRIQSGHFTPDGRKDETLTVNSRHINMSDDIAWGIFSNVTSCRFRNNSTVTGGGIRHTIPTGAWLVRGINDGTPFMNYSGCTGAELQRQ